MMKMGISMSLPRGLQGARAAEPTPPARRGGRNALAMIVAAALLVPACGSDDSGGSPSARGSDASTSPEVPEIDNEGTVRVLYLVDSTLDPSRLGARTDIMVVWDTLLYDRDPESGALIDSPLPNLATSYSFAPDGSYLELKLRSDVTFHDGTPFDADAVKANIERQKDYDGGANVAALSSVTDVTVVDPQTVHLNLAPGQGADIPWQLAATAGMMVSPACIASGQDIGLDPANCGSGPYLVESYTPGQSIVLERAPGVHWDPTVGLARRIEWTNVPDQTAKFNALRTGQADVIHVNVAGWPTLQDLITEGIAVTPLDPRASQPYGIAWHATADLANPLVREAANLAIDRESICQTIMHGACTVPTTNQPVPENHWTYSQDPGIPRLEYNPTRARELLQEAGIPNPEITISVDSGRYAYPPAVQSDLEEVGFHVTLESQPYTDGDAMFRAGSLQAIAAVPAATDAEPSVIIKSAFVSGKRLVPDTDLPEFNALVSKCEDPSLSTAERAELYGEVWAYVAERNYYMIVAFAQLAFAHSPQIGGVQFASTIVPDMRRMYIVDET